MTTATEIIRELLPRRPVPVLERQTGLSYGWGLWLRALPQQLGRISREKSEQLTTLLAQRPARPADPVPDALNRWQAWRSLFYQGWEPPLREDRGMRWLAGTLSLLMHLVFALFLLWVAVVSVPPPPQAGDSSRVRIEFLGRGTPEQTGGGPPAASDAPSPAPRQPEATPASASAPSAEASPAVQTPPLVASAPELATVPMDVPEREIPEPTPVTAPQPLQVTEVPAPTQDFVLPPPNIAPRPVDVPVVQPREPSIPTRDVVMLERPAVQTRVPAPTPAAPQLASPQTEVRQREIPMPLPRVQVQQPALPTVAMPTLQSPEPRVREAEIAAPSRPTTAPASPAVAAAASPTSTSAPAATSSLAAPATSPATASARGNQPQATAAGPAPADRTGGWETAVRGDDWDAAARNRPGDSRADAGRDPGLYNADGRLNVPEQGVAGETAPRGAPGSANDAWTRERIAQSGTFLKRVPYGYEPTMFDQYWVPNESLLAEWVRKGIKKLEIPLPGTNKKISCVVSMLQLGGGCGVSDPNLNEQPAEARPPPEIPVKRTPIPTDS